ncbi:hypothetical protein [Microlunatus sp. GCM10028923]
MINDPAAAVASFAYELGVLKRLRRAGWWQVGVRDPEVPRGDAGPRADHP